MTRLEITPLPNAPQPSTVLNAFADEPWPVLLESARVDPLRGRYSFFSADPVRTWVVDDVQHGDDPFAEIRPLARELQRPSSSNDVPYTPGFIGLLSYELGHAWEKLPRVPRDEFTTPALAVGLYSWGICWDHQDNRCWLMRDRSLEHHEGDPRWKRLLGRIEETQAVTPESAVENANRSKIVKTPDAERQRFLTAVRRVTEYIEAGDIYQANLSRKIEYDFSGSPMELYSRIRTTNPAPFAAFFQPQPEWALISASPEQFLHVRGREVSTRPIKGTRPRWTAGDLDLLQAFDLQTSEKDRAENTMIVDLLRNDLSRVCQRGTVKVPRWCELETFSRVHHLVSEVTGTLREDADLWDLFAATFPGGSITGAPKIRAMEIISELEQSTRGCYCGSLFIAGLDGSLQSSILIRTLTWKAGRVQVPVGGGIVADSIPENEFAETVHKSAGLIV
ncbi:aminodeoxychorismate synthase component I [Rubinisphaera margarita]|uniref:aminodeoxychorismate synthase component I n=1 Tax=Rubinisphaera margarita TaxID=2909586 RepID=UPI001EE9AB78|nr:aminodeoxychorismate synthase component I [Rubinisphaera margarita]MCG6157751.1 aminodeoxychorismate synthase component I [Rubinisphaera margarita]